MSGRVAVARGAGEDGAVPRIDAPTLAEHQARRRTALVQAAAHLLSLGGPAAVTPAAVAQMAGLARSTTYQYFPSTGALVSAAVEEFFRAAMERLDDGVPFDADPMTRIEAYVATGLDAAVSGHTAMAGLAEFDLPVECRARVRELHDEMTAGLRAALADASAADDDVLAGLVIGLIQSGARQVADGADAERTRSLVLRLVRGALG
jgi:AcrR family transcriptional regulator